MSLGEPAVFQCRCYLDLDEARNPLRRSVAWGVNLNSQRKKILFVSSMPASRSNALGVQTLYFAEPFAPEWAHIYWYNLGMGESDVPNSYRLNTSIPHLWPFATGRGFITRLTERMALDWWRGDHLIESKKNRLRRMLGSIGFSYVAPIKNSDATRCRDILEMLDCPFVVHIWDFWDETLNADYQWLFSRAEHVFCLSPTMIGKVREIATCEISLLPFTRPRSQYRAKYCGTNKLRIGLIGTLHTYEDGLDLLSRAIGDLRRQIGEVRVSYIGRASQLEFIPAELKALTDYAGFLDDDERDKALADCNVGYLPGPMPSPQQYALSRYSVPSRSADYMAIGLPVVAALHPLSAANAFFSPIRNRGLFLVGNNEDFCRVSQDLRDEATWSEAARECLSFFDTHFDKAYVHQQLCAVAGRFL
jgi:glycosyltransferase involved in cell wall biosynthesis